VQHFKETRSPLQALKLFGNHNVDFCAMCSYSLLNVDSLF